MPNGPVMNRATLRIGALMLLSGLLLMPAGCGNKQLDTPPPASAGPSYTGPTYLRGTVGSLATLRNNQPMPVSGYGIVVGLDNTGHRGAPIFLRQRLLNEMRKQGVGQVSTRDILPLTPAQLLDSMTTAVVTVEGLIPPGATKGTPFDLLVTAVAGTQTTSLAGGTLYTVDLSMGGTNVENQYTKPVAQGHGPIYLNPFGSGVQAEELQGFRRQAIVVGGGTVTEDRMIEIVLNQPSWQRARAIEDRINERFPMAADDRAHKTANAVSNLMIRIEVPKRYTQSPSDLLDLIAHFYINNAPGFEETQARRLYETLERDPTQAGSVGLAWKALGRTAIPVLREHYKNPRMEIRLTALEAGAYLQDERASQDLLELAGHPDEAVRASAAQSLVYLPRSVRGARALRQLLDDESIAVRLRAYESLASIGDPIVERMPIRNEAGLKFLIDRVPSNRPLVYITYLGTPRIVIFDEQLGFEEGAVARLWSNRLMLRKPETLAQGLFGLQAGGTLFVPIVGRSETVEIGSPRWQTTITDTVGDTASLIIESKDLHDRFNAKVAHATAEEAQAMIVAQLIERDIDEVTLRPTTRIRLLDVREADADRPITVYYQAPNQTNGKTYKIMPTVATFAYLLAAQNTIENPVDGLDFTYSQVVDVLYHLCQAGHIAAPIRVDTSPMAALIDSRDRLSAPGTRPETSATPLAPLIPTAPDAPGAIESPEAASTGSDEGASEDQAMDAMIESAFPVQPKAASR